MKVGALKRSVPVTIRAHDGAPVARAIAQEKAQYHCNGVWLDEFRWEPGYQPPKETDTVFDLHCEGDGEDRIARGHVSPDASRLTDIEGRRPISVCFDVTEPNADWFTHVEP